MNGKPGMVATIVCSVLVLAAASVEAQVAVPATQPWYDTTVSVGAGDALSITASGMWTSGEWTGTADGYGTQAGGGCYLAPNEVPYALIGRIGQGVPFFVGASHMQIAQEAGTLQLSMNDCPNIFWDNSGALDVTITVLPDDSVVAIYTFDEADGDIIYDLSGNDHHLTMMLGAALVPGRCGNAISTRTGYAVAPNAEDLQLNGSYTIVAWARSDSGESGREGTICGLTHCFQHDGTWAMTYRPKPSNSLGHVEYAPGPRWYSISGGELGPPLIDVCMRPGEWVHVAATYDDDLNVARLYVNGEIVVEGDWDSMSGGSTARFFVGTGHVEADDDLCGSGHFFPGDIDELRLYSRALATSEIESLYDNCPLEETYATRDLSNPTPDYCGEAKTVQIVLDLPDSAVAIGVEEILPPNHLGVTNISHGGVYDEETNRILWGPIFTGEFPAALVYDILLPMDTETPQCFEGTLSINGFDEPIGGDACTELAQCPLIGADAPQAYCEGCADCGCATCGDHSVLMCEVIGYACAWKSGCNDNLAEMTRAAYLWLNGGYYCFDAELQTWEVATEPPDECGCCVEASPTIASVSEAWDFVSPSTMALGSATLRLPRGVSTKRAVSLRDVRFPVDILAPEGASVMAAEVFIPQGWEVDAISGDGSWDPVNRKVKWGPYFSDVSRTLTFVARPELSKRASTWKSGSPCFYGSVSFDGSEEVIKVER